jgi:uncharacterized membrane protein
MGKGRLEAFTDGVMAVIITIMVLELKTPHGAELEALRPLWGVFLSYILSFVYVGIYWNNHHHMLHAVSRVSGAVLWANLHLLFWLSLMPFLTGWIAEERDASLPAAVYGGVLCIAGLAFLILQIALVRANGGKESELARALRTPKKEIVSLVVYLAGIALAFVHAWLADLAYLAVAIIWLIPDTRIERNLQQGSETEVKNLT